MSNEHLTWILYNYNKNILRTEHPEISEEEILKLLVNSSLSYVRNYANLELRKYKIMHVVKDEKPPAD